MIVARDTDLQFRFPVGKQYVIVALHLKHGDDAEEALRSFIVQEDIPVYMEMPLLATAHRILSDPDLLVDQLDPLGQFQYSVHSVGSGTKLVQFYENSWKHFHDIRAREDPSRRSAGQVVKKGGFEHSYHQICNQSIEDCERVILFQHKQQRVVQKLLLQRKEEQDSMHANQSDEMNKATATNQIHISALVEKHMAELDELERKYKDKLFALNKKQSVEFREFIQKYHSLDHATETMEPELEEDPGEQKWHRRWFKLRDQPTDEYARQDTMTVPKFIGLGTHHRSEERHSTPATPTPKKGLDAAVTVSVGKQNPVLYNIELNTLSPTEILHNTQADRISLIKTARTMFSHSLTGMVVISEPSLHYKGRECADLVRWSENQTDPMFDSLTSQIDHVRAQTIGVQDSLENGDYFITRHSNMGEFQVLFHFMGESGRYIL